MITAISDRKEARVLLVNSIGTELAKYQGWSSAWDRLATVSPSALCAPENSAYLDPLVRDGVLYDVSSIGLNAASIARCLSARCQVPRAHWGKFVQIVGLEDIDKLSAELARVASLCEQPVRLALAGRLKSAIMAVPAKGCGTGFEFTSREHVIDLVMAVARYNLLAAVLQAGEDAHARFFEPTGMAVLDDRPDRRAVTVSRMAETFAYNGEWVRTILAICQAAQTRPLTAAEQAELSAEPGLVDEARAGMAKLISCYGDRTPGVVQQALGLARAYGHWLTRVVAREAAACPPNRAFYTQRQTNPLARLFLACVNAMNWLEAKSWTNDPLDQAARQIRRGDKPKAPAWPKKISIAAYELFFLVRCCIVRDPKAPSVLAAGRNGCMDAAIDAGWRTRRAKHKGRRALCL